MIYHGDCLEIMPTLADKSVDMILCDLPYGTTACKWDTIIPFEPLWAQYKRLIKDNGAIVLTASQPFTSALVMSNVKMFKYALVWSKKMTSGFANAKRQPMKAHEDVLIFSTGGTKYNPQMIERGSEELKRLSYKSVNTTRSDHSKSMVGRSGNRFDNVLKYPNSVLNITAVMNNGGEKLPHPTQKPVSLFEYLIRTYTNEGDTVLDNCAGSFTTAIACMNTNRKYICIEKDDKYFEIGKSRIENHQPLLQAVRDET